MARILPRVFHNIFSLGVVFDDKRIVLEVQNAAQGDESTVGEVSSAGVDWELGVAVCNCIFWGCSAFAVMGEGKSIFGRDLLHSIRDTVCECCDVVDECVGVDFGEVRREKWRKEFRWEKGWVKQRGRDGTWAKSQRCVIALLYCHLY